MLKRFTVKAWQDFLDSLSTKGGNLFMLFVGLIMAVAFVMHTVHDGADGSLVSLGHDLVVGFSAALWAGLSGASSRQQMADRVETLSLTPKPPTVPSNTPQPAASPPAPGNGG